MFVAIVSGLNRTRPYAATEKLDFFGPCGSYEPLPIQVELNELDSEVALFSTEEEAQQVAQACHWNGQRHSVRKATEEEQKYGRLVELDGPVSGCQEAWRP